MDVGTGLVGLKRRISERALIETATVPPVRGRAAGHVVTPTRKQVRNALDALAEAGLIRAVRGTDVAFVFQLPQARQDKSARRNRGQIRGQESTPWKPHNDAGLSPVDDPIRGPIRGPHQGYIYSSNSTASFEIPEGAREAPPAIVLPERTDLDAWELFAGHWREQRRWSISRAKQCAGHLKQIADAGGDPTAVLQWALARGLADLLDAHRRMRSDAERDARPGESLANRAVRKIREGHGLRVINGSALLGGGSDD